MIGHELRNPNFYRKTGHIMLLVVLQQLITIGINFLDNVMVGSFGEVAISAVAFGNQFYSFFQMVLMGLGSGAIVMSSQCWGRREYGAMREIAAIALRLTFVLCAVFTVVTALWPWAVLRIFTNDWDIIRAGAPYMQLVAFTFLPSGLVSTATYLLRSTGRVGVPLIGSSIAFFLNFFFNWVFIFGELGAPRLELVGAAVGTVIARAFEFCFVFGYFILKDDTFAFRLRHVLLSGKRLYRQYMRYSIPVLVSDTILGLSLMLTTVILGHLSSEISAANAMVTSAVQVLTVLNMGMAGASSVVVGNTIGEGDLPRAQREGNAYVVLSLVIGLIAIPVLLLLEQPYLALYNINDTTRQIAHGMVLCTCFMLPMQAVAYITSKGLLRGGGDTRFLLVADSILVWLVSLPLGALAGFVWHLPPVWIYFFLRAEHPLKGLVCLIRFCTGKWIKVIGPAEEDRQDRG